jgi:hypothetical protein
MLVLLPTNAAGDDNRFIGLIGMKFIMKIGLGQILLRKMRSTLSCIGDYWNSLITPVPKVLNLATGLS